MVIFQGLVTSNADPEKRGRVSVKAPEILGQHVIEWIEWLPSVGYGPPQIGDPVLIFDVQGEYFGLGPLPTTQKSKYLFDLLGKNYGKQRFLPSPNGSAIVSVDDDTGVKIGSMDATEPVVLGDKMATVLDEILVIVKDLATATAAITVASFGTIPVNSGDLIASASAAQTKRSAVDGIKSKWAKVAAEKPT